MRRSLLNMFRTVRRQSVVQKRPGKSGKSFDLNIERILEDWEVCDAVREIIANAIDEQVLTNTEPIEIYKDEYARWHIRDFGRGLRYEHLTQKENAEKLDSSHVIGKFGIGLKDALATFDRHDIGVLIRSAHGEITIGESRKHGFEDVVTLHAHIFPACDPNFVGTEFILDGATEEDISRAKDLFLMFACERIIEKTVYGDVLAKDNGIAKIYVNGVEVAEEDNFLFSYNITSTTRKISQALNRERKNVGRGAYSDRVKAILLSCRSREIADSLVNDLKQYSTGLMHDELKWIDVQEHAVRILGASEKTVFMTSTELMSARSLVDEARSSGYVVATIPENLRQRISGLTDVSGNVVLDLTEFARQSKEKFKFQFVEREQLTKAERDVFDATDKVFSLIGGKPRIVEEVRISETMVSEIGFIYSVVGLWDSGTKSIVVKRSQLSSIQDYAGTLLHEAAHALSGAGDLSRSFELELTRLLGIVAQRALAQ
jgi:hypothetical protein